MMFRAARLFRLLILSVMVSCASTVAAQTPSPQVVTQFDDSTISRLLLDVQTTWRIEPATDGHSVYRVSAQDGLIFTLTPRACSEETGCVGLLLIATFTRDDNRSLAELDQLLSSHNDANPNAKVYRTETGIVILQSYVNAVYGISYANAQAQLLVFGQEIGKMRQSLTAFASGP